MSQNDLKALADIVESSGADLAAQTEIRAAIAAMIPGLEPGESEFGHTDDVLHLIDQVLPEWTISLTGKAHEPNGHWTCTLRESSWRDSDALLGLGKGPQPHQALLAAMLRVMALQSES